MLEFQSISTIECKKKILRNTATSSFCFSCMYFSWKTRQKYIFKNLNENDWIWRFIYRILDWFSHIAKKINIVKDATRRRIEIGRHWWLNYFHRLNYFKSKSSRFFTLIAEHKNINANDLIHFSLPLQKYVPLKK